MSEYKSRDMKLRLSFLGSSYTWARGRRLYPVDSGLDPWKEAAENMTRIRHLSNLEDGSNATGSLSVWCSTWRPPSCGGWCQLDLAPTYPIASGTRNSRSIRSAERGLLSIPFAQTTVMQSRAFCMVNQAA